MTLTSCFGFRGAVSSRTAHPNWDGVIAKISEFLLALGLESRRAAFPTSELMVARLTPSALSQQLVLRLWFAIKVMPTSQNCHDLCVYSLGPSTRLDAAAGISYQMPRGHLSRPACRHVKQVAKGSGGVNPGLWQSQDAPGFFAVLVLPTMRARVRNSPAKSRNTRRRLRTSFCIRAVLRRGFEPSFEAISNSSASFIPDTGTMPLLLHGGVR